MTADYSQQWREYRSLRNQALAAAVGIIPLGFLGHQIGGRLGVGEAVNFVFPVMLLVWIAVALFTGARVADWKCPRCGKSFGHKWWYKSSAFLATRCANCGLPKFANG